jgi:glycosyltransferase involved in cell wall biosynthesis
MIGGHRPLVSVVIPTYNEENALPLALDALSRQNYQGTEIIVVDSNSTDDTAGIARDFGVKLLTYEGKLLGARYTGFCKSEGEYVLLLDADQILKEKTIGRALEMMQKYDMLVLEEDSYRPETRTQKVLSREREFLHAAKDALNPVTGSLLPRFFRRDLLQRAFDNIPETLFPIVLAQDHFIIYLEAYKITKNIGILVNAVSHMEPKSLTELIAHNFRFGQSTRALAETGLYTELIKNKAFQLRNIADAVSNGTIGLAIMRSLAYQVGYLLR